MKTAITWVEIQWKVKQKNVYKEHIIFLHVKKQRSQNINSDNLKHTTTNYNFNFNNLLELIT